MKHKAHMSFNGVTPKIGLIVVSSPFSTLDSTLSKSISYTSVLIVSSSSFKLLAKRYPLNEVVEGRSSGSSKDGIQINICSFSTPLRVIYLT